MPPSCLFLCLKSLTNWTAPRLAVVQEDCVVHFVDFDLDDDVLFTPRGGGGLAQGGKGVPIGGFISVQAAKIWAIWKEHYMFSDEHRGAATARWQQIVDAPPWGLGGLVTPSCTRLSRCLWHIRLIFSSLPPCGYYASSRTHHDFTVVAPCV